MLARLTLPISRFIRWTGEQIKWLTTILVILIFCDALARYLFSASEAWMTDLEWHVFALIFILGAGYALQEDQHVRVDVLYSKWTIKRQAWIDLIGTVCFLIPWCLIVIYTGARYAETSFAIGEGSPDPGGLPARWAIKWAISIGFFLLLLQAIATGLRALKSIVQPTVFED